MTRDATIASLLSGVEPAIPYGVLAFNRGGRIAPESSARQTGFAALEASPFASINGDER